MVLPTTYASALLLLLVSLVCFGSWPNALKLSGPGWRFELFYFDFAVGALLLAVIAAFTFGTFGSEMAFNDRILVAGRSAQAFVIASGFLFNLGNMLLLAAISLLGMSAAFPITIGMALLVASLWNFRADNILFLIAGLVLLLLTLVLGGSACRLRDYASPQSTKAPSKSKAPSRSKAHKTNKGLMVAILGGIPLGLFYPLFARGAAGEFGLGAYAGILLFCIGLLISTIVFNFYFMNIAIEGGALAFTAYFRGNLRQHLLGFIAGAAWAVGALAAALACLTSSQTEVPLWLTIVLPLASVVLAFFWGTLAWKEFPARSKNARVAVSFTLLFYVGALALVTTGLAR